MKLCGKTNNDKGSKSNTYICIELASLCNIALSECLEGFVIEMKARCFMSGGYCKA